MRGATRLEVRHVQCRWISIHAPHAGRDELYHFRRNSPEIFQSTRPMRGATAQLFNFSVNTTDFNPRAPCGARPDRQTESVMHHGFQSTRPMRGATTRRDAHLQRHREFQSTRPRRGATTGLRNKGLGTLISIHAPHAGRDLETSRRKEHNHWNFNPRAPCGARLSPI